MIYRIVFEDSPDGSVGAYLPEMPGVGVVGENKVDAIQLLDEAVRMHVEAMIEDGTPIPDATEPQAIDGMCIVLDRTYVERVSEPISKYFTPTSNATPFWIVERASPFRIRQTTENIVA